MAPLWGLDCLGGLRLSARIVDILFCQIGVCTTGGFSSFRRRFRSFETRPAWRVNGVYFTFWLISFVLSAVSVFHYFALALKRGRSDGNNMWDCTSVWKGKKQALWRGQWTEERMERGWRGNAGDDTKVWSHWLRGRTAGAIASFPA